MIEQTNEISVDFSCKKPNYCMKLIFDILTPRPHFIIIHHEKYRKVNATNNEINQLIELVNEFLLNKPQYDHKAILSFHRGKWYQQKHKHFHAHLCVPKKPYCQEAKVSITPKAMNHRQISSTEYVHQLHKDFVLSKIKYAEYRNQCLSMAYLCYNDPVSDDVPLHQFSSSKFTLVFLASSPRIGVIAKTTDLDLKALYHFMNNFYLSARKKLSLFNYLYENFGAHLCLHVSGTKMNKSYLIERSDRILVNDIHHPIKLARLVGYMQMDEQLYLRWLPTNLQPIWLHEFQKNQHIVVT